MRLGGQWPNCTRTVLCGQPPGPPVNGTRSWIQGAEEDQETYDTQVTRNYVTCNVLYYSVQVRYGCQDGSQFDTDGDGLGDSPTIDIRSVHNFGHKNSKICDV